MFRLRHQPLVVDWGGTPHALRLLPPREITSLAVGGAQSTVQAYLSCARDATLDTCHRRPHAPAAAPDERMHALRVHERADKRAPPAPTAAASSFSKEVICSSELWCLPAL